MGHRGLRDRRRRTRHRCRSPAGHDARVDPARMGGDGTHALVLPARLRHPIPGHVDGVSRRLGVSGMAGTPNGRGESAPSLGANDRASAALVSRCLRRRVRRYAGAAVRALRCGADVIGDRGQSRDRASRRRVMAGDSAWKWRTGRRSRRFADRDRHPPAHRTVSHRDLVDRRAR